MNLIYSAHKHSMEMINLIASEAWFPPEYKLPYILDMFHRYSYDIDNASIVQGLPGFSNRPFLNEIENKCISLLQSYFGCTYASVKPISGLNMMLSVLSSVTQRGNYILSIPPSLGGHSATKHIAERMGLIHEYIPITKDEALLKTGRLQIDVAGTKQLIEAKRVQCVYLDLMHVVHPIDLHILREAVGKKTIVIYDASHVLGLIMGGQFQSPLEEGADILIGTTHKTFPGPHKGVVLTNSKWLHNLYRMTCDVYISHHHIADVATLMLLLGQGKEFFDNYAVRLIENSTTFFEECDKHGIPAIGGQTHQIWIDLNDAVDYATLVHSINGEGIIVNEIEIPFSGHRGLRLGLQEITYRGFDKADVTVLCSLICHLILEKKLDIEQREALKQLKNKLKASFFQSLSSFEKYISNLYNLEADEYECRY